MISPLKAKGVGELGLTGVAPAIANAIYNATGVRVRQYPITLGTSTLIDCRLLRKDRRGVPPRRASTLLPHQRCICINLEDLLEAYGQNSLRFFSGKVAWLRVLLQEWA